MPKYMLSNHKLSYYLYGDDDAVAFCQGDNFPQFWNGGRWVEVQSFLKFSDNAVEITKKEFLKKAEVQNADVSIFLHAPEKK